jgi:hypothetical protein
MFSGRSLQLPYTGRGHGELIRERFGVAWAWLSMAGLAAATIGSLVTEFTGVAGIGELYGLSRGLTLPVAAGALLIVVATGSYRRVERIAIVIGLFELAFFDVAWAAHPNLETLAKDAVDLPLYNREFMYLVAAVIGAVFNTMKDPNQKDAEAYRRRQAQRLLDLFESAHGRPASTVEDLTTWAGTPEGQAALAVNSNPETGHIEP